MPTFKKQLSLETTSQQQTDVTINRLPRKRPAKLLDYDSDQLAEYPPLISTNTTTSMSPSGTQNTQQSPTTATNEYVTELSSLKNEISQLKEIITTAAAQIKQAIASFHAPTCNHEQSAMETEAAEGAHSETPPPQEVSTPCDLPDIIRDRKNDIATISQETHTMFKQCMQHKPTKAKVAAIPPNVSELIAKLKHDIANVAMEMRAKFNQQDTLKLTQQPKRTSGT